ncbi:MAG: universal stress protein [Nitrospirales bacterium]
MKVLLAVEQTRISAGAIRMLSKLMLPSGSDLYLLHVNPIPQKITGLAKERILRISQQIQEVQKDVMEHAHEFLNKVEKTLRRQDVQFHTIVKKGYPGEEILKTIHAKNIDLVVLGTRGYSQAAGFLMGSVSQWILHEARCSVMIARPMAREKKQTRGMKVILATDGSSDSQSAVDFVNSVELPDSTQIMILHVVQKHVYETEQALTVKSEHEPEFAKMAEELLEARGREGTRILQDTRKALASSSLQVKERLVFGNPAEDILKTARYIKADLIVMGARGPAAGRRMFLGSVSNKVVHSAGCSVAIIRKREKK